MWWQVDSICNYCCGLQALAEAIQSVTEMNQDLAVEKIEIETATDLEVNGPKWFPSGLINSYIYGISFPANDMMRN